MTTTNLTPTEIDTGLWDTGPAAGAQWTGNITYSIPGDGSGTTWAPGYGAGEPTHGAYGTLNSTQAANYGIVASIWDSYISASITQVADNTPGDIRVAFTDVTTIKNDPSVYAYAYSPPVGAEQPVNGDIWIDSTHEGVTFAQNSQDFQVLLHETGHSLGLKHPFETPTIPAGFDFTTYTIMSYTAQDYFYAFTFPDANHVSVATNGTIDFTPMVLDIKAIQDLYAADTTTAAGNTTYTYHDGDLNGRQSIYDAGGTDTIDISALSRSSHVDLRPGAYSDLDYYTVAQQVADLNAAHPGFGTFFQDTLNNGGQPAYTWTNNLGIAFSTTIENVIGSAQADTIIGNTVANVITGGGGADTETGGGGNDVFRDTGANLNGDIITDFVNAYVINVTNAVLLTGLTFATNVLSFALSTAPGTTYTMTLNGGPLTGTPQQRADLNGGVDIFFGVASIPTTPTITLVTDHGSHFDVVGAADTGNTVTVTDTNGAVPAFNGVSDGTGHYDAASAAVLGDGSHGLSSTASDGINTSAASAVAHVVVQAATHIAFSDVNFTIAEDSTLTGLVMEGTGLTGTGNSHGNQIVSVESAPTDVNTLIGGTGADTLVGGIGADHLQAGDGNDFYSIHSSTTQVSDSSGIDVAVVYGVNYALVEGDGVEALVMTGSGLTGTGHTTTATDLHSIESATTDVNTLIGGSGADLLVGGIGADNLQGGGGNDFYAVYNSGTQISDSGGADVVFAYGVNYALAAGDGVEALVMTGSGLTGTGHAATSTNLYSTESVVTDVNTLIGGAQADLLVGGIGADNLQAGGGDDVYAVYNSGTQISDTGGSNVVYAYGVNFQLADGSGVGTLVMQGSGLTGTGSSGNDILYSVGIGNTLNGGAAGNDSFVFDTATTSANIVTGFQPHSGTASGDFIALSHFPDTSFAQATGDGHISQSGNDVIIADASHTIVTLQNIHLDTLGAADFWFA